MNKLILTLVILGLLFALVPTVTPAFAYCGKDHCGPRHQPIIHCGPRYCGPHGLWEFAYQLHQDVPQIHLVIGLRHRGRPGDF